MSDSPLWAPALVSFLALALTSRWEWSHPRSDALLGFSVLACWLTVVGPNLASRVSAAGITLALTAVHARSSAGRVSRRDHQDVNEVRAGPVLMMMFPAVGAIIMDFVYPWGAAGEVKWLWPATAAAGMVIVVLIVRRGLRGPVEAAINGIVACAFLLVGVVIPVAAYQLESSASRVRFLSHVGLLSVLVLWPWGYHSKARGAECTLNG